MDSLACDDSHVMSCNWQLMSRRKYLLNCFILQQLTSDRYRVYYSASDPAFGGSIPGESAGSATLYATSNDGLSFDKPSLGRVEYHNSTSNNILFDGTTAVAVYDDSGHDPNASARFKAWGNLPGLDNSNSIGIGIGIGIGTGARNGIGIGFDSAIGGGDDNLKYTAQLGGSAVSANGLNFTDYRRLQNPSSSKDVKGTWRFDAQTSLYFDPQQQRYTATMRAFRPCPTCGSCPIWWQPHGGCQSDLSSTCTAKECNRTVRAIGASTSNSSDFAQSNWGPNVEVSVAKIQCQCQCQCQCQYQCQRQCQYQCQRVQSTINCHCQFFAACTRCRLTTTTQRSSTTRK